MKRCGGLHRRAVSLVIHPGVDAAQGWQLDHLGSADAGRRVVPGSWQRRPWHDEGRYSDGREDVAHIELHGRAERCHGGAWTQAAAHVPDEPVDEVGLVRHLGSPLPGEVFEIVTRSPPCPHLRQLPPPVVLGLSPRVIRRTDTLHSWVEEDEARATLRIGCREQDRDAGRGAAGPDDRALGADRVHDGPDVVHGRLERLDLADPVGEPRPAAVQHDHPPGRRESLDVADEQWLLPGGEQIPGDPAEEDDVRRAIADELVGDGHVAASRVRRVRWFHRQSLLHLAARCLTRGLTCRCADSQLSTDGAA